MNKKEKIEEILLTDFGCFDDLTVDKLLDLFAVSKSEGIEREPTVCCETCKYYPPIGLNKVPCNNCIEYDKWQQTVC